MNTTTHLVYQQPRESYQPAAEVNPPRRSWIAGIADTIRSLLFAPVPSEEEAGQLIRFMVQDTLRVYRREYLFELQVMLERATRLGQSHLCEECREEMGRAAALGGFSALADHASPGAPALCKLRSRMITRIAVLERYGSGN